MTSELQSCYTNLCTCSQLQMWHLLQNSIIEPDVNDDYIYSGTSLIQTTLGQIKVFSLQ